MADKKYASFTDDFRGRIEQERSANPRERSADFKGRDDEDQSKPKSEESDSTSVASSDGGEVMWEPGKKKRMIKCIFLIVYKVPKGLSQESQQVSSKARSQEYGS